MLCWRRMLRCLWKGGPDIDLIASVKVALGRNPETTITDTKCPRRHLDVIYDSKTQTATVRPFSSSTHQKPFSINEKVFDDEEVMKPGDVLYLLPGKYGYRFEIPSIKMETKAVTTATSLVTESAIVSELSDQKAVSIQSKSTSATDHKSTETEAATVSTAAEVRRTKPAWVHASDELMVYTDGSNIGSEKVAGFDLDGTLIVTKSGHIWPKNVDDWKIAFAEVPGKLKKLRSDGYRVVIFTNQKGISTGSGLSREEFRKKIEHIVDKFGMGVVSACFVAPKEGRNRKPMTGMWEELERNYNAGMIVDRSRSIFVGDAAGRGASSESTTAGKKRAKDEKEKDHSCSDRLFAINLGVKFLTPEEFFLDQPPQPFKLPEFSPKALLEQRSSIGLLNPATAQLTRSDKKAEVIVLVGYPASGKSQFYETYLKPRNYACVSRDILKTWQKCVQETAKLLKSGKSVVVDNTNPDAESRQRYVDVAKSSGAPCRCFVMACSYDQAMHNNKFRHLLGADREHEKVNVMVLNSYRKRFEQPSTAEGFGEIVEINFIPKFDDPEDETIYGMYLLEK